MYYLARGIVHGRYRRIYRINVEIAVDIENLVGRLAICPINCHIHIPTYDFGPVVVIWMCGYMCVIVWFGCCIYIIMTASIWLVV